MPRVAQLGALADQGHRQATSAPAASAARPTAHRAVAVAVGLDDGAQQRRRRTALAARRTLWAIGAEVDVGPGRSHRLTLASDPSRRWI